MNSNPETSPRNEQGPQAISFENPEKILGRRIENLKEISTVKYVGPLKHQTDRADADQVWLGIQWDNPERGKHNGTVEGYQYFICDDGLNSGSLLKHDKANFGINIFDGIHIKYSKKGADKPSHLNKLGINVEYDEEAYFETKKRYKKKVEFWGFDKIWQKLSDLEHLKELSLSNLNISDLGPAGSLGAVLPNLRSLSLEGNLLFDWNQVFLIGRELKHLEELYLSGNKLREPEADVKSLEQIKVNSNDTVINEPPLGVFENLKVIILVSMGLTWKTLTKILPLFLNVTELVLCNNKLNDFENFPYSGSDFKNLELLNLEENDLKTFEGIKKFKDAPRLNKLILNKNDLNDLGTISGFESVHSIILEDNNIENFKIFPQLNRFPNLEALRITKNPISVKNTVLHVRQRVIAEIKGLKSINGGELKKYERKDCEIYYLRNTFQEFFEKSGQPSTEYDFDDFKAYCDENHPRIAELMKKYGNPYDDGIKGKPKPEVQKATFAALINIQLNAFSGPCLGKPAVVKKFTNNTLIVNLKQMLAKQYGIPANQQKVYCKLDPKEPFIPMNEDLKDLKFYGVSHGHEIWIGDTEI